MPSKVISVTLLFFLRNLTSGAAARPTVFPPTFKFGAATAAYQVEGGWDAGGKGESIWDRLTHKHPDIIFDRSTGDVAADSYHRYLEDVALLRFLGVDFYRFSVSWPRILPSGLDDHVSEDGLRYYNGLIDELLKYNITPVVTMYHWDLPQSLQDLGGWTNPYIAEYFVDYARVLFENFGDRVRTWITFNEPDNVCLGGYETGEFAPALKMRGVGSYLCAHALLNAHGLVYRLYEREYRSSQNGAIGIALTGNWLEPASGAGADTEAAERAMQFSLGWFAHPIFSVRGDYPPVMRHRIDSKSSEQGLPRSRLPRLTRAQLRLLRGAADFLGLNHYTSQLAERGAPGAAEPSYYDDRGVRTYQDRAWPATNSTWLRVAPWGFRKVLNWVKHEYGNPPVLVTENGVSQEAGLSDPHRVAYLRAYLRSLLQAVAADTCNVLGYTLWSLVDNFEWRRGYSERFGLFHVDYASANKTRTPRDSAAFYRHVIAARSPSAMRAAPAQDEPAPTAQIV